MSSGLGSAYLPSCNRKIIVNTLPLWVWSPKKALMARGSSHVVGLGALSTHRLLPFALYFSLSSLSLLPAPALRFFSPLLLYFLISLLLSTSTSFCYRLLLQQSCPSRFSTRHTSRPAVLQITMASTPKQNPWLGPLGILDPITIEEIVEEIRKMDDEELLKWIQQKKPKLLRDEVLENFKKEYISGDVFLDHANDRKFFKEDCNLPAGPSDGLAKL